MIDDYVVYEILLDNRKCQNTDDDHSVEEFPCLSVVIVSFSNSIR